MTAALILFGVSAAVAQSAVTGKIVDETGAPLIGASVTVPGTSQGVSTDVDGNFTLKTDAKEIEISYVGYVPTKNPSRARTHAWASSRWSPTPWHCRMSSSCSRWPCSAKPR